MNLIVFGLNHWSEMWKRTQTLVSILAKDPRIHSVLFVNSSIFLSNLVRSPTSIGSPMIRDCSRFFFPRRVSKKIFVYTPIAPPLTYDGKPFEHIHRRLQLRFIKHFTQRPYILYLNRLISRSDTVFAEIFDRAYSRIFDWSDDFVEFEDTPELKRHYQEITQNYIKNSNLVFTVNELLLERALKVNPNSFCIRNGTDFNLMKRTDSPQVQPFPPLVNLNKPIIGYIGYLNPTRIDAELIKWVAIENPDLHFVFLGPKVVDYPLGRDVPKLDNVDIFPPVPYSKLPEVLKCFDVCMIPNKINTHTAGNDPIKLFDYLGSGKPIVSTPTAGIEAFSEHIGIAESPSAFSQIIRKALENDICPEAKARRQAIAQANSWDMRGEQLKALLFETIKI